MTLLVDSGRCVLLCLMNLLDVVRFFFFNESVREKSSIGGVILFYTFIRAPKKLRVIKHN